MKRFRFGILAFSSLFEIVLLALAGQSLARPRLAWNPSPGPVDGYSIHRWTLPDGPYLVVDAGPVTEYQIDDLPLSEGQVNCFSITAYNGYGESGFSNSVCWMEEGRIIRMPARGAFGNITGSGPLGDQEVHFLFEGFGRDMVIRYLAYDVDLSDEVEISLNGRLISHLPTTGHESWGEPQALSLPAEYLNFPINILTFSNTYANWRWAVSDVVAE
jgi:hypothetical protein